MENHIQDLPKFQFGEGERGLGGVLEVKSQSAKICLNFNFQGGGGGVLKVKPQSAKICLNFNFQGGGGVLNQIPEQDVLRNLSTHFALPLSGSLCITDSLSHTTYVETKQWIALA